MFRSYGGSPSTRRDPNRISPPSTGAKPAIMRSSVVFPHPEGPSSVKSSPSAISRLTRSTALTVAKRFSTARRLMFTRASGLLPHRLDVGAELRLQRLRALDGDALVVDVRDLAVEVGAHASRELHGHLRG